jgi:AraC-like DNA-binding protein
MVPERRETAPLSDSLAFRAWRSRPQVMPAPHAHTDVELNLPLDGTLRYFFAGRFQEVRSGQLAALWAGMPHRLVAVEPPGTEYLCLTLPLGWFLSWSVPGPLTARLLDGEMVVDGGDPNDAPLFTQWATELSALAPPADAHRITLLEVEARLRRLSLRLGDAGEESAPRPAPAGPAVERIAAHLSRHYRDPELSAASVAGALGLHPNYAQTAFKEGCGMTLWDYVTRLRVSHAQRLLLTTDWTVDRVALESGFGSPSRFFAVFRAHTNGKTPRQYRLSHSGD